MQNEGDIAAIRYNLGNRIRVLRKGQGLSQYVFSSMIELDRTYLIEVEKGRRNISVNNLCKIAAGLGMSLADLFEGVDEPELIKLSLQLIKEPSGTAQHEA